MLNTHGLDVMWFEVFKEVARRGSFTAAGAALGYTQSAVSRQILSLEAEVGVALFDRQPRGVRLTEEGRCLLDHATAVLDRLETARCELRALRDMETGRLRVGAFDTADAALVPRALIAFRTAHPKLALSVVEATTPGLLARLLAGDIDLAIVSAYPHQTLDADQFDLHHLADDPLLVALPRDHRLASRPAVRLAELAEESWIEGFPSGTDTLINVHAHAGFRPRIDFAVREWIAKQGFVAAGLGLAFVPALAASATRPDITLVRLHPDEEPVRTVYAATVRGLTRSPAQSGFLHCLDEVMAELGLPEPAAHR
ncbi:LysR family transcriptional regulator [Nonomuraea sp. NPDC049152]|uniref:LysR family transcriptional regulator n=1 Tax=Nonomuraea sp. NPDC049152 TaxID=3154350 RepID=UPI00340FB75E